MASGVLISHCLQPALWGSPAGLPGSLLPQGLFSGSSLCPAHCSPSSPPPPAGLPASLAPWWSPRPLPGPPPASGPSGCTQRSPADVALRWVLRFSSLPPGAPLGPMLRSRQGRPIPQWSGAGAALPWAALRDVMMCVLRSVMELWHSHRRWGDAAPAAGRPQELQHLLQKPLEKTSVRLISVFT